ncbi:MAG: MATE family efflux transporter [Solobacterium sp.]|nr:MATE family efflux transporter [Solobacterium sp.]
MTEISAKPGKYFGDKEFYSKSAKLAIPSMLQQLLSSAMGIVDTMMVSWIGKVSAVGVGSQLEQLAISICFGVLEGVGIFAAQFFGASDFRNMKRTFGLALILNFIITFLWFLAALFFARPIMHFYVKDPAVIEDGLLYLQIVKYAYVPMALAMVYNHMFRSIHKTNIPMWIGIGSMTCNLIFNYLLIFGKFGFPALGVRGAAFGTVIAQYVSLFSYMIVSKVLKVPFIGTLKQIFSLDLRFIRPIMHRTIPTIINEAFFGFGSSMFIKAYALLGTKVTDAYYVGNTITRMFFSICNGLSVATAMMLGAELGAGRRDDAIRMSRYFITMSLILAVVFVVLISGFAGPLVDLFGMTDAEVYRIAVGVVRVSSLRIAMRLFIVVIFSALRSGGDSRYLMFLDAGIMWTVGIPLAYISVLWLGLTNFIVVFLIVQMEQVVRALLGMRRLLSNKWAINLTKLVN